MVLAVFVEIRKQIVARISARKEEKSVKILGETLMKTELPDRYKVDSLWIRYTNQINFGRFSP